MVKATTENGLLHIDLVREVPEAQKPRVIAIQHGQQIFNLAASFQVARDGLEHQFPMPAAPPSSRS